MPSDLGLHKPWFMQGFEEQGDDRTTSHLDPEYPLKHVQLYRLLPTNAHRPLFKHGLDKHGFVI